MAEVYGEWTSGGGAEAVDFTYFLGKLQELQGKYGDIFRIPPYFFYITKAFSVLEG